jgi:phage tail protein X
MQVKTAPFDRWDTIALRVYNLPELGWAIADANPELADQLVLSAGLTVNIPDLNALRRPLTAANPAREDGGQFLGLPPDVPRAPAVPSGPVAGDYIPMSAIGVTVAPLEAGLVPLARLPAYPTLTSLGAVSTATFNSSIANFVTTTALNSAIANFVTTTALNSAIANFVTTTALNTAIANFVTTTALNNTIANYVTTSTYNTGISNLVTTNTFNTTLSGYVTTSNLNTALNNYILSNQIGTTIPSMTSGKVNPQYLDYPTLTTLNAVSKDSVDETINGNKHFTGFTRLGDDSIKKKTVQGITNAGQGQQVSVTHGVNATKIRSVSGNIFYTASAFPLADNLPSVPIMGKQAGFASTINISGTSINVINDASNSGSILSRPFILTIEYTS